MHLNNIQKVQAPFNLTAIFFLNNGSYFLRSHTGTYTEHNVVVCNVFCHCAFSVCIFLMHSLFSLQLPSIFSTVLGTDGKQVACALVQGT